MPIEKAPVEPEEFSLVLGGPLYQLFVRSGMIRPPLDRLGWRMFVIAALAWAPLLLLTALDGRFLGGVHIPFLHDLAVHVRLLVTLPLLVAAEVTIHDRMPGILRQFRERRIVTETMEARFREITGSAIRLGNSIPLEVGLLIFVLVLGRLTFEGRADLQSDTWYAATDAGARALTPAGIWYEYVSVSISQFLWLRWIVRLLIWWRFLWQVSRLELNLVPTHPDRCCGLGFLDGIVRAMTPFLKAQSCLLFGYLANRILWEGAKLPEFYPEIGAVALFIVVIALGPLCVFTARLVHARDLGLLAYGSFASECVNAFDRKWIAGERPSGEEPLGTGDISSLGDLGASFAVVQSIIPFPFGRSSLLGLVLAIALPLLPLLLTMFSLKELLARLVQIVL